VIVGDGYYTDAYVTSLKQQAKDCDSIIFTGFQSGETLHALFSHAQIMVHPSDNEGLPIGVLEAMSYGLPVLVSDIVEHEDLIKNEVYLFERGNIESLAEKLLWILSESKENRKIEGSRNKALIQKEFSWESVVLDIVAVYASPMERPLTVSHS
jgi:glycosyltransferase involved in cell wall biosynthesis